MRRLHRQRPRLRRRNLQLHQRSQRPNPRLQRNLSKSGESGRSAPGLVRRGGETWDSATLASDQFNASLRPRRQATQAWQRLTGACRLPWDSRRGLALDQAEGFAGLDGDFHVLEDSLPFGSDTSSLRIALPSRVDLNQGHGLMVSGGFRRPRTRSSGGEFDLMI